MTFFNILFYFAIPYCSLWANFYLSLISCSNYFGLILAVCVSSVDLFPFFLPFLKVISVLATMTGSYFQATFMFLPFSSFDFSQFQG